MYEQRWPLEQCNVSHQPYTTHDIYQARHKFIRKWIEMSRNDFREPGVE